MADPRHERSVLLDYSEVSSRDFDEWSMKLVMLTAERSKTIRRFSAKSGFNPYNLSGQSARELLLSLKSAE